MSRMLPSLPPWDGESLARNKFDSQFMKGARDFWKGNVLEKVDLKDRESHEHEFRYTEDGVECKKCRMGWSGKEIEVREGKLYFNNKLIEV